MKFPAIPVAASGASITLGAASVSASIPNNSSGKQPFYVRLATTTAAYVKIGKGAQTATTSDLLVTQYESVVIPLQNADTIAALQAATGGVLVITPLEI